MDSEISKQGGAHDDGAVRSMKCLATNLSRYQIAKAEHQRWMLSQSEHTQEERIAEHYTAFARLAMQLRELIEARKHSDSKDLDDTIRFLTGKIREGHLMEFGIQLEWPNEKLSA